MTYIARVKRPFHYAIIATFLLLLFGGAFWPGQARAFDIDAKAALLMDADTGQVLFEKNADELLHPASLAKIMTLLVVMDAVKDNKVSLDDEVRTSRRASQIGGSRVWLAEGEVHSLKQMLKAIAISSANDASVAVAEFMAGTEATFAQKMTERARELGMTKSVFYNADGLPPESGEPPSLTTAREMARAAQVLVRDHPEVLEWTSTVMETFREQPLFILYNTNRLISTYDGLDGLKTGHTQAAGWSLVATAKRGDMRIISVVMGTESQNAREERTRALLDHAFNRYVPKIVAEGSVGQIHIPDGAPERVDVTLTRPARILHPRGAGAMIEGYVQADPNVQAPVEQGAAVGEYVISVDGRVVLTVPVVAEEGAARANVFVRLWRAARDFVLNMLP